MEPTLKNMVLAQIDRLDNSNDDQDRQSRTYLNNVIKDRNYPQDSWIGEIEEVEQILRLVKKAEAVRSTAAALAKKSAHCQVARQKDMRITEMRSWR